MRTYEPTHPWLIFQLDLRALPPELWLLLGEARSKCEHLAGVPLRPPTNPTVVYVDSMTVKKGTTDAIAPVLFNTTLEGFAFSGTVLPGATLTWLGP
jgi:hypothetical protein